MGFLGQLLTQYTGRNAFDRLLAVRQRGPITGENGKCDPLVVAPALEKCDLVRDAGNPPAFEEDLQVPAPFYRRDAPPLFLRYRGQNDARVAPVRPRHEPVDAQEEACLVGYSSGTTRTSSQGLSQSRKPSPALASPVQVPGDGPSANTNSNSGCNHLAEVNRSRAQSR
jgi:hypothetical protein